MSPGCFSLISKSNAMSSLQNFRREEGNMQGGTPCWFFVCMYLCYFPPPPKQVCYSRACFPLPLPLFCLSSFQLFLLPFPFQDPKEWIRNYTIFCMFRVCFLKLESCLLVAARGVYLNQSGCLLFVLPLREDLCPQPLPLINTFK